MNPSFSFFKLAGLAAVAAAAPVTGQAAIVISGFLANPTGTDNNIEYVQLRATENIDFSTTAYSVVFANNGTATAAGWTAGGSLGYGFNLTSGSVNAGDVFYVGGSARVINGAGSTDISSATWIRTINTGTTAGDGFGTANASGIMGNGGGNADGVAVFSGLTGSLLSSTVPLDAVFYGTAIGTAFVTGGTTGYQLPNNDLYSGGKLQTTSALLAADPGSAEFVRLTGTFNTDSDTWTVARVATEIVLGASSPLSAIDSAITVVPEPSTYAGFAGALLLGFGVWRRSRRS